MDMSHSHAELIYAYDGVNGGNFRLIDEFSEPASRSDSSLCFVVN
jgi:hypothetical protein